MIDEKSLVPFESTELRGERLLVLAPHPDDEVFGCGGLIALHTRERREVHVLVATDGAEGDAAVTDREAYRERRESESRAGLDVLGGGALEFLRFPDRGLSDASGLVAKLVAALRESRPDLVLAPHPLELHPDHVALARALVDAIQGHDDLREGLATTRVAFYEVSNPLLPNTLVDISAVAELKKAAAAKHESQVAVRNYLHVAEGLNSFRTLTLDGPTHAEAFCVIEADRLRVTSWGELCHEVSAGRERTPMTTSETLPISVVIRTKDRPEWLAAAVGSVLANDYPSRIIVVNDGGSSPRERLLARSPDIEIVEHSTSEGRSEAMNAGVRQADTDWIAFLDDDDLYYTDHLSTLATAARSATTKGVYSDAVSVTYATDSTGSSKPVARVRTYAQDFDPDLLLIDNYIPLPTLLVRREAFLAVGGFDRRFDLFEDWDFLIRLTAGGRLLRVPRVTCEIRHFPESGSAVQATPSGSKAFRDAKVKIWEKHSDRLTNDVLARAIESQKAKIVEARGRATETEGRARHLENDVLRLEREKTILIDEVRRESTERDRVSSELAALANDRLRVEEELNRQVGLLHAKIGECQALDQLLAEHRDAVASQTGTIESLFAEVDRLNEVVKRMEATRAWRLHLFLERIRGK
jgi:LmbE family N-acetylglucosaminyl deacetylase